jgi:oligoribonuclease
MIYCAIDIETCGLSVENCDILEFGAVLDDLNNPKPIKMLSKFHCYFNLNNYHGEPYALSMHSKIFKRIAEKEKGFTYCSPSKFGFMFKKFLLDNGYKCEHDIVTINAAGKNLAGFDIPFLNAKTDIQKHVNIRKRVLDPSILFINRNDIALPSLSECKKRAGLSENVAHDAISDAIDVIELLRKGVHYNF